jgi:membrane-bound metal-dependent hydrolase YbcI (DUF457 family)
MYDTIIGTAINFPANYILFVLLNDASPFVFATLCTLIFFVLATIRKMWLFNYMTEGQAAAERSERYFDSTVTSHIKHKEEQSIRN